MKTAIPMKLIKACEEIAGTQIWNIGDLKEAYNQWMKSDTEANRSALLTAMDEFYLNNHAPALPVDGPCHYIP